MKDTLNNLVLKGSQPLKVPWWLEEAYNSVEENVRCRINYYRFLHHVMLRFKPKVAIELGVEFGMASAYMALAAETYGGLVIGIDHNFHEIPGKIISKHCKNYTFIQSDTLKAEDMVLSLFPKDDKHPIGLLFQDSSHHYDASVKEWEIYSKYLCEDALWICDDITPAFKTPEESRGMVDYFEERPGKKVLYPGILHHGNTIGVIWKE